MARPRKQTYTLAQYLENVNEGYISNDADTQRNPAWKPIVDGLAVTVLTDDYIPALILAEEDIGQKHIVDGGSRTAALMMIRYGNYKIKSSVENPIIKYKSMSKDKNGNVEWTECEFDIRNKTYDQFPKELQKAFNEYQLETVIHECDSEGIAMYLRRYNVHTGMNTNQKMFIHIPKFAGAIRKITNENFFVGCTSIKENEKEKGMTERVVMESVMCSYHFDKWNKNGKTLASYLNENACIKEFETIQEELNILSDIITDKSKILFNSTNTFIWLTLFHEFMKTGTEVFKFGDFLEACVDGLCDKIIDGKSFNNGGNKKWSTKDKIVIETKLNILRQLMKDYLHIERVKEWNTLDFIKENINSEVTEDDIESYKEDLELLTLYVDNDTKLLEDRNQISLIGVVAYSYKNEVNLDDWFKKWFETHDEYILDQKKNFNVMVNDLEQYIKGERKNE